MKSCDLSKLMILIFVFIVPLFSSLHNFIRREAIQGIM